MSTRLEKVMAGLKAAGKKGIYIYITAGAPDVKASVEAVKAAVQAGADVIELGIPFSDPMADGPVIQAASVQAIRGGMNLRKALDIVAEVRKSTEVPIVGMGYINNMLNYGFEKFVTDAKEAGMDGIIIPDVPHEESEDFRRIAAEHEFHLVEFVTPGTTAERMQETFRSANGFIYCVSNNGVTGVKKVDYGPIGRVVKEARKYTDVPLSVGFGIGSPEAAVEAAAEADAVIVGSAVVKRLMDGKLEEAMDLIRAMRKALDTTYGAA